MIRIALAALLLLAPARAGAQQFTAMLAEDGRETPAGVVLLDPAGRLSAVSAPPGREAWLRQVVEEANAAPVMHQDRAPPAGSPRFANATEPLRRGDPAFTPALRVFLQRYYGVTLK